MPIYTHTQIQDQEEIKDHIGNCLVLFQFGAGKLARPDDSGPIQITDSLSRPPLARQCLMIIMEVAAYVVGNSPYEASVFSAPAASSISNNLSLWFV